MDNPVHVDDSRQILHVDMDAFYASIEQRDTPAYKKTVSDLAWPQTDWWPWCATTANYVARQFGIHSAMPAQQALNCVQKRYLLP